MSAGHGIEVRHMGLRDYLPVLEQMREYTRARNGNVTDQIWILQHYPVYTLGVSCRSSPEIPNEIPVVTTDRGGQITYHGPGQAIAYVLIDLKRRRLGVRQLVSLLEQAVIEYLHDRQVLAGRRQGAPGVYVGGRKIAALGLRVSRGCSYHGISFNVNMDKAPFEAIDPCGMEGLEITQTSDLGIGGEVGQVGDELGTRVRDLIEHHTPAPRTQTP